MASSQTQALEAQAALLESKLKRLERERLALLLKVGQLQACPSHFNEERSARISAEKALTDVRISLNRMIERLKQENSGLQKEIANGRAEAQGRQQQQQRQLAASQAQLPSQSKSLKALKAENSQLHTENLQLYKENQHLWEQLKARKVEPATLAIADQPAANELTTLQQQILLSEIAAEVDEQQLELAIVRSHLRLANEQKQHWDGEQQQLQSQVAQLQSQLKELQHISTGQQNQQTVGDYGLGGAQQALEAKTSQLQSEILELKARNQSLQQQLEAETNMVAIGEKPIDDRKDLLDKIKSLEEKMFAQDARLADHQQVFKFQQEALSIYPPLPPFMARFTLPETLTISDDTNMQQQHELETEQLVDTLSRKQLEPLRVMRDSDPDDAPSTPELVAGSYTEGHTRVLQPSPEDCSSSSQGRRNKGLQAGRAVVKAAAAVINFMHRRRAKT